jgi:prepilin-type N-terminal cleavage/methylation domain-containing protein
MTVARLRACQSGFTLVETLVAMALAGAVLLPASFWLYRSHTTRAALDRFRALQSLEAELNRAVLLRLEQDAAKSIPFPAGARLRIHVLRDGPETRLLGTVEDRRGRTLAELQAGYFGESAP